jgi:hypothetical protein
MAFRCLMEKSYEARFQTFARLETGFDDPRTSLPTWGDRLQQIDTLLGTHGRTIVTVIELGQDRVTVETGPLR